MKRLSGGQLSLLQLSITLLAANVNGATYTVTTIEEKPYVMVKSRGGTTNDNFEGFIPDLLKDVAKEAGFDYNLRLVKDERYGVKVNGRWIGMIGEIVDGQADLAAAAITISANRKKAVDFSEPFMTVGITMLTKKGYEKITSIEALADQTDVKYGAISQGNTEQFFKNSTNPKYRKIWQAMTKDSNMVNTIADGITKVRNSNGKYVFLVESSTANYWLGKQPCDLAKPGNTIGQSQYAFAMKKNSVLKTRLNNAIKKLKDSGRIDDLWRVWWSAGATCPTSSAERPQAFIATTAALLAAITYFLGSS